MNPALLILLPILLAIFLTGGISVKSPPVSGTSTEPVTLSERGIPGFFNSLQINSLVPGSNPTPVPIIPPGVTATPAPSNPPGATFTPIPTSPPGFTPFPTQPGQKACTTDPRDCTQGACTSSGYRKCTYYGPAPCTPVDTKISCTSPPTATPNPACYSSSNTCQPFNPTCPCPNDPGGQDTGYRITCSKSGRCISVTQNFGSPPDNNCDSYDLYKNRCLALINSCANITGNLTFGTACNGKPVIYLYPKKITNVNVSVITSGQIVVSDPFYPIDGWKNVQAHPDGTLFYKDKIYSELFYETSLPSFNPPTNGIVIKTDDLETQLTKIITQLGLTKPSERVEFLEWWLPKLQASHSPYILFSIFDPKEKERIDTVKISPKPDTFIEFVAYFKPLKAPIDTPPLFLPQTPPPRIGFTVVEWGGVLDNH